jgi:hypothetical protein
MAGDVHPFPTDLTVRRMVIAGDSFVVRNFIQRPAVGAFKGLSHSKLAKRIAELEAVVGRADEPMRLRGLRRRR